MRLERTVTAIFCLVAAALLWVVTGPLGHDKEALARWFLACFGGAVVIGAGLWLSAPFRSGRRGKR